MRGSLAKKLRRASRLLVRERLETLTHAEFRWWARPRVFRVWATVGARAVKLLVACGWFSLEDRWRDFMRSMPKRGVRWVVGAPSQWR